MVVKHWEHVEHDADIGLRAVSATLEGLFEAMGEALTAIITEPSAVRCPEAVRIQCTAPDRELLLVDWLNALIYEMATRGMLFGAWRVALEDNHLEATVEGERVDRARHRPVVEVKGATYTGLAVQQDDDGHWHGTCIVDV